MCFSPTASFVAGGALSAAGVYTLNHAKRDVQAPFAAIPLLFGLQQVIEGFVWISFGQGYLHAVATYAYVLFSHVLWPFFLPFAVWKIEPDRKRKRWLAPFVAIGGAIGATIFAYVMQGPVSVAVVGNCLAYDVPTPSLPMGLAAYVLATCGSCLLSSRKYVRVFGLALFGSLAIAYWMYQATYTSVWCFFAAILSFIVFVHLRQNSEKT